MWVDNKLLLFVSINGSELVDLKNPISGGFPEDHTQEVSPAYTSKGTITETDANCMMHSKNSTAGALLPKQNIELVT
jgi:hypothetical protein